MNTTHAPRYANAILSILNPPSAVMAVNNTDSSVDRKRKCGELLDNLIPPLFCQVASSDSCKRRKAEAADSPGDENDEDQSNKDDENITAIKSNSALMSNADHLASLKQQLQAYKNENQRLLSRRQSIYNSFVELHECYETGLDGIARANDLRNVPDNVMMDRPVSAKK